MDRKMVRNRAFSSILLTNWRRKDRTSTSNPAFDGGVVVGVKHLFAVAAARDVEFSAANTRRIIPAITITMYQERWANAVGLPRLKLCQLSVIVLTSAARFSSVSGPQIWRELSNGSNIFLINCVAKWLNASWLDVLRDTNQPKKMMQRHFKEEFIIKNSVNGGAPLSRWKLRDDAIRVG
ncbi:hypothetical protein OUZ56_008992 [Daphnia magna]|uniref:Uncharacterized protein n=1 Tax=Daphnia magna TaxID=35525 RepID=A0ABR0AEQ3_9CRUS|nr:hypothetical protein OUZ56_008992 [Daphnia magna]